MIELTYKENTEYTDVSGLSIAEARELYKTEFGIADKAAAFLNGRKISTAGEDNAILKDNDRLVFKASAGHRMLYLAGALILAMAVTGGVFAYGFISSTATITGTVADSDFASVTANTSGTPAWTARGMQKGQTGPGTLFDIDTATSGYTADFSVTIMLSNTGDLIKVYRNLTLSIEVRDSADNLVDINDDGSGNSNDFTILTLENSRVMFNICQAAPDRYTVKLRNGIFTCNAGSAGWTASDGTPQLFCELTQK